MVFWVMTLFGLMGGCQCFGRVVLPASSWYKIELLGTPVSDCTMSTENITSSEVTSLFLCPYVAGSCGFETEEVIKRWVELHSV
jgi:hypothetical protein